MASEAIAAATVSELKRIVRPDGLHRPRQRLRAEARASAASSR